MNQKQKIVSFGPDTIDVSQEKSRESQVSSRESTPYYPRKRTSERNYYPRTEEELSMLIRTPAQVEKLHSIFGALQAPGQEVTDANDELVEKIENGTILLQLKTLERILPSMANGIGFESLSIKLQSVLNVEKLTEHRPIPKQNMSGDAQPFGENKLKIDAEKLAEFSETILESGGVNGENLGVSVEEATVDSETEESAELSSEVEESNEKAGTSKMLTKLDPAECAFLFSVSELHKVILHLTKFCEDIFKTVKLIVARKADTDKFYRIVESNIKQLLCLEIRLPEKLTKRYGCAAAIYKFSTGFYVKYFSNLFKGPLFGKKYHHYKNNLNYLSKLACWLELLLPLLECLGNQVSCLTPSSSRFAFEQFSRVVQNKQTDLLDKSGLIVMPSENRHFANKLFTMVTFVLWDVNLVFSEMSKYQAEKLDAKNLL